MYDDYRIKWHRRLDLVNDNNRTFARGFSLNVGAQLTHAKATVQMSSCFSSR